MKRVCFNNLLSEFKYIVILIVIYAICLHYFRLDDPLLYRIKIAYLSQYLNGWCMTHFLAFTYIGYKYPTCFEEAMILGLIWELFEFTLGEIVPIISPKLASKIYPNFASFYYGRYEDIIMNLLGFILGKFIFETFNYLDKNTI
jgi:hypothetical protein